MELNYQKFGFFLLFLMFLSGSAYSQTLRTDPEFDLTIWPLEKNCYQHSMSGGGDLKGKAGYFFGEAFLTLKWWGSCDAKIRSSFMNAEAGRVIERRHGGNVGVEWNNIKLGATLRRRAVHHIWRNKSENRTEGFPSSNDARIAKKKCRSGIKCPSIGYYDFLGPFVGYDTKTLDLEVALFVYKWKELTLPWPFLISKTSYEGKKWQANLDFKFGGLREMGADASLLYKFGDYFWVGYKVGRLNVPGWKKPVFRTGVVFSLQ